MDGFAIPNSPVKGNFLDWALLKKILRLAEPFKRQFYVASFFAVFLAVQALLRPWMIQVTVDKYIFNNNYNGLLWMSILLIAQLFIESIARYYFGYITSWLGQSVIRNLRVRVLSHIISLKLQFFDRTPIGTATTRTINDVEAINDIFSEGIIAIIADLLTIVFIIGFMLYEDWRLTLVSLSTFPILVYATYVFKEKINISFQDVRNQVARMNAFLQEHITGMRVIQIFTAEEKEMEKFEAINKQHKRANIDSILYFSIFFPLVEVVLASAMGLLVWYGAIRVVQYETTLGTLIGFILLLNLLFRPLRMLADKFNTLQMGIVASDRVFKLLEREEHIENTGTESAKNMKGNIEFKNVWFSYLTDDADGISDDAKGKTASTDDELAAYTEGDSFVLKNVTFKVGHGKTLAIVGATGSGKTSIINILNRFYEINRGEIDIDGTSIKEYDVSSLRSQIGMVLQDVFLFSGSIMDNITLRNDHISREKVIAAAKLVGAHDFIMRLPGQYDYNVMERGATLSMGQRQLISFIRALVFDPKILILDEATSSIDTESEQLIQGAIEKLISGRTSIIIAHRLSTIQEVDAIMVLDRGEIKEMGTHEELLAQNGYYKRLYEMQFKKPTPV